MTELREVIAKALWASEFRPLTDGEWDQAKASMLGPSCFRQADLMLAAIGETHAVIDKERWERVIAVARAGDGMFIVDFDLEPGDLDPLPEGE